jgi:hypothetical protein
MVFFLDYFTAWTDIIFTCTVLFCLCFPGRLPLWFWIGIACLMTSVGVVGSLVFSTIYNENLRSAQTTGEATRSVNSSNQELQKHIVGDFMVHILPVIVLFFFYRILEKRFYNEISILKSALFPIILSIIYICTHNVETVYKVSDLSSYVIIILTISVWLSSYQIFVPKKCSFIHIKNN